MLFCDYTKVQDATAGCFLDRLKKLKEEKTQQLEHENQLKNGIVLTKNTKFAYKILSNYLYKVLTLIRLCSFSIWSLW